MTFARRPRRSIIQPMEDDLSALALFDEAPEVFYLPQQRRSRKSKPINEYQHAREELSAALKELYGDDAKQNLLFAGFGVYREVVRLASLKKQAFPEQTLIDVLNTTRMLVLGKEQHPTAAKGYKHEMNNYLKLTKKLGQASTKRALLSLMLSLLCIAIIMISGVFAFASFGLLAPISILGIVFGKSLLFAAAATATTCVVGTGAMMGNAALFFNSVEKGILSQEMRAVEAAARKSI